MKLIDIKKSDRENKKYMAIFEDNKGKRKTTHFGLKNANDFTLTGDKEARKRYRERHKKDLDTNDPTRAGYLAYFILWNKPTIKESIADYKKRFNL
jgi:hypothetical protein